jgi:hypothetical protein
VRFMCIGVAPAFGVSASVVATASGACSFSVSRLTSPGFRRRTYSPQWLDSADLTWSAWSGAEQVGWLLHWIRCGHEWMGFSAPLARLACLVDSLPPGGFCVSCRCRKVVQSGQRMESSEKAALAFHACGLWSLFFSPPPIHIPEGRGPSTIGV